MFRHGAALQYLCKHIRRKQCCDSAAGRDCKADFRRSVRHPLLGILVLDITVDICLASVFASEAWLYPDSYLRRHYLTPEHVLPTQQDDEIRSTNRWNGERRVL
jgi:hypothetical protein